MISKTFRLFLVTLFLTLVISCYGSWNFLYEGNNVDERTESFNMLSSSTDDNFSAAGISSLNGKYTVLIISDTHFGNTKKEINCAPLFKWLEKLRGNPEYPVFAICLGDVVDLGRQEEYDLYNAFCKKLQNEYGIRLIFNSCGNHDIYQGNWENWKKNCYPYKSFYKFKTSKFSWYCLDTASGTIGLNQYRILSEEMKTDPSPKVVFTHYPFVRFNRDTSNMAETTERNKLISEFAKNNVKCVLGGHLHTSAIDNLGFMNYIIPSFGYSESWGLLYIDEDSETISFEFIS